MEVSILYVRLRMSRRAGYKFTNRKNPIKGIAAFILGVIALGSLILAIYLTFQNQGAAPLQYAVAVILSICMAIAGMVCGIMACMEKDIFKLFPVSGITLNIVALVLGGFILYMGLSI